MTDLDKTIERVARKYEDVDSAENIDKINSNLYNIQNTMTESLQLLMDKENKINGKTPHST